MFNFRRIPLVFAAAVFIAAPLLAESALDSWLKKLDNFLKQSESKHKSRSVAVAAVRGTEADAKKELYWKGKKEPVTSAEFAEFKASVTKLQEGKTAEGQAGLEKFIEAHPASPLTDDAKKTLEMVKAEPAAAPAANP